MDPEEKKKIQKLNIRKRRLDYDYMVKYYFSNIDQEQVKQFNQDHKRILRGGKFDDQFYHNEFLPTFNEHYKKWKSEQVKTNKK